MTVYVDDMQMPYRGMKMCHMIADTLAELHAMADKIGVSRAHYQGPPKTRHQHYDIALSKRALAVKAGAVEITWRQAAAMKRREKETGAMGDPTDAERWYHNDYKPDYRDAAKEQVT
jgi:hypothetical protein